MRFTSEDIDLLRLVMANLIEKLSRLYIRDRHLYACDEQGILSHQEKVRHKDIQKKDAIDDKDNGKLLFVVDS
jgi:isopentenyl phosphate kinase